MPRRSPPRHFESISLPSLHATSIDSIPKVIYFTYEHALSGSTESNATQKWSLIKENMARIRRLNPEFETRYFDDEQCAAYIRSHLGYEMEEYFNMEAQGMYRADIFRVIVLYFEGGYYLDVDIGLKMPLHSFIRNDTQFATIADRLSENIFQAFIAVVPKHPIMAKNIKLIRKYYRGNLTLTAMMGTEIMRRSILHYFGYDEEQDVPHSLWQIAHQAPHVQLFKECDVRGVDCPAMYQIGLSAFQFNNTLGTAYIVWDWVQANNDSTARDVIIPFYSRAIEYDIMHDIKPRNDNEEASLWYEHEGYYFTEPNYYNEKKSDPQTDSSKLKFFKLSSLL